MPKLRATKNFGPYRAGQVYNIDDRCAMAIRALGAEDVDEEPSPKRRGRPPKAEKAEAPPKANAEDEVVATATAKADKPEDEENKPKRHYHRRDMKPEAD